MTPIRPEVNPNSGHSFDANDRLLGEITPGINRSNDANGNTLRGDVSPPQTANDVYDFENRLITRQTTINGQPTTIDLFYDGDGNRVKKLVTEGNRVTTTKFLVDDRNPTAYAQVVEEFTTVHLSGTLTVSTNRMYVYGHDLLLQHWNNGSGDRLVYYGYDGHGSIRFLYNTAQSQTTLTDTYTYDAFGILIASTGTSVNDYGYASEQWDRDLGLSYNRARYLNPNTGRFWTIDTFEGRHREPLSLHKYLYCSADPVNRTDPSGHEGYLVSMLSAMSIGEGIQGFKAAAEAKVNWEMRAFQQELLNDLNPNDLKRNQKLGYEGETIWVKYLNSIGFRAIRAKGPISAVGPDVYAARIKSGRLEIMIGEVKASRRGLAGIGALKWNVLNTYRQMSYSWIDKYASQIVEGIADLAIDGIGLGEFETLLDRGEIDVYLLGALKSGSVWKIRGFRLLHANLGDLDLPGDGPPELIDERDVPVLPGF